MPLLHRTSHPENQAAELPPETQAALEAFRRGEFAEPDEAGEPDAKVEPVQPSAVDARILKGRDACSRLLTRETFEDWLTVGIALALLRDSAMHRAGANKPEGGRYRREIAKQLRLYAFDRVDKAVRSAAITCAENRDEILAWIAKDESRAAFNHPTVVLRRWRASTKQPTPKNPPRALIERVEAEGPEFIVPLLKLPKWRAFFEARIDGQRDHLPPACDPDLTAGFTKAVALAEKGTTKDITALIKRIVKQADGCEFRVIRLEKGGV
jgi:hypothetical protein